MVIRTIMKHPSQWCEGFKNVINDASYKVVGKWVDIDTSKIVSMGCDGRSWAVVDSELPRSYDTQRFVCEHVIEIGD